MDEPVIAQRAPYGLDLEPGDYFLVPLRTVCPPAVL